MRKAGIADHVVSNDVRTVADQEAAVAGVIDDIVLEHHTGGGDIDHVGVAFAALAVPGHRRGAVYGIVRYDSVTRVETEAAVEHDGTV